MFFFFLLLTCGFLRIDDSSVDSAVFTYGRFHGGFWRRSFELTRY